MKRITFFTIVLMCFSLLVSCGVSNKPEEYIQADVQDIEKSTESQENVLGSDISDESHNEQEIQEEDKAFIKELYYQGQIYSIAPSALTNTDMDRPDNNNEWLKSLDINYPQIYGLEDVNMQNRINELLYDEVILYHNVLSDRSYINYSLNYEIMSSTDEEFSILFYGSVSDYRTENRFAYAITFDINEEKKMKLDDYYVVNDSFVTDDLFTKVEVIDNNFATLEENTPFVEQYVMDYDLAMHEDDFYITGDKIGIIIPTYNSMGYILIEGGIGGEE